MVVVVVGMCDAYYSVILVIVDMVNTLNHGQHPQTWSTYIQRVQMKGYCVHQHVHNDMVHNTNNMLTIGVW